jgi:hypothetical protein
MHLGWCGNLVKTRHIPVSPRDAQQGHGRIEHRYARVVTIPDKLAREPPGTSPRLSPTDLPNPAGDTNCRELPSHIADHPAVNHAHLLIDFCCP